MSVSIYLNGTDDLTDGKLATPGNGITLGAINEVVTVHLRAEAGYENAEAVTVPAPIDCHVSADGSTWGETAFYAVGAIPDTNTPLHVKRVVNTVTPPGSEPYETGIPFDPRAPEVAVFDVAAPVIAGTLTAVAGVGQVTLSGPTATDNAGIAKWQYRVDGGAWVDIVNTAETMPTTVVSGLTAGTAYDFDVRALDAAGNASGVLSDFAVPLLLLQDFESTAVGSLPAGWANNTAGEWSVQLGGLNGSAKSIRAPMTTVGLSTKFVQTLHSARASVAYEFRVKTGSLVGVGYRNGGFTAGFNPFNVNTFSGTGYVQPVIITLVDGVVRMGATNTDYTIAANTEYHFRVVVDCAAGTYTVEINGVPLTNGGGPWAFAVASTSLNMIILKPYSPTDGDFIYFDDIRVEG